MATPPTQSPRFKGVLFDLDGTLLDTEPLSDIAMNAVLAPFSCEMDSTLKAAIVGTSSTFWAPYLIDAFGLSGQLSPSDLADGWETELKKVSPSAAYCPGAEAVVSSIKATGAAVGLCTSSKSGSVAAKSSTKTEFFDQFTVVVCGDDAEIGEGKPAPDIFLLGAKRLAQSLPGSEWVVFEDSVAGCQAASAAGMYAVGVVASPVSPERMEEYRSCTSAIVSSLKDVTVVDHSDASFSLLITPHPDA